MNKKDTEPPEIIDDLEDNPSHNGNGHADEIQLIEALSNLATTQKEIMERLEELELKNQNQTGAALLQLVNLFYNTDDKHILELTEIPRPMLRPIAYGRTLHRIMDPDVQSGEVSLSEILLDTTLRGMRSISRKHLSMGMRLAEEQLNTQAEEAAEERELGG